MPRTYEFSSEQLVFCSLSYRRSLGTNLRLGLRTVHTNPSLNWSFKKRLPKFEEFEITRFVF